MQKLKALIEDNQQIKLITTDAAAMGGLCNDLRTYISNIVNYVALLSIHRDKAIDLMRLIQNEYHLKNE